MIPDTSPVSLVAVGVELGLTPPYSLLAAHAAAVPGSFDPAYAGEPTGLYRFRNYGAPRPVVSDPDAQIIIDNMPMRVFVSEATAINTFVIAEKASGYWGNYDSIILPELSDPANALHDWLSTFTWSNVGTTHSSQGLRTVGHIKTVQKFSISVNFTPTNGWVGVAYQDAAFTTTADYFFRAWDATNTFSQRTAVITRGEISPDRVDYAYNSPLGGAYNYAGNIPTSGYIGVGRAGGNVNLVVGGVVVDNTALTVNSLMPNGLMGVPSDNGGDKLLYNLRFYCSGAYPTDIVAHNTNVQNLLATL